MHTMVDFCIIPITGSTSLSSYIATCQKCLKEFNLKTTLHAYGTTIEGEWDEILKAIKVCHEHLHQEGVPRIHTQLKIGTRIDKAQCAADKIISVQKKLKP